MVPDKRLAYALADAIVLKALREVLFEEGVHGR